MRRIVGRAYRSKRNGILGPWRMAGLDLDSCLFDNCHVSCSWRLKRRFLIQNVIFLDCSHLGSASATLALALLAFVTYCCLVMNEAFTDGFSLRDSL